MTAGRIEFLSCRRSAAEGSFADVSASELCIKKLILTTCISEQLKYMQTHAEITF